MSLANFTIYLSFTDHGKYGHGRPKLQDVPTCKTDLADACSF